MGLSGPKKRNKISNDPNNTTWANNKEGYGQKILASQGWKAGDYLGATSANHADHYTAANASHIRVMLREDNLGLGAQLGKSTADTFGLATLSGIFGRLNGKSDADIQKQQDVQRDLQLQSYQTQKFGTMSFVSGGLLVGDKMEFPSQKPAAAKVEVVVKKGDTAKKEKSKKRKLDEEAVIEGKRAKKVKQSAETSESSGSGAPSDDDPSAKERKTRKKRRHESTEGDGLVNFTSGLQGAAEDAKFTKRKEGKSPQSFSSAKLLLKEEKRARKEERRLRRERKEERRRQKGSKASSSKTSKSSSISSSDSEISSAVPVVQVQVQAPTMFGGSRHAVRQRYIQQKRLASMDPRAVQEILMLKSSA